MSFYSGDLSRKQLEDLLNQELNKPEEQIDIQMINYLCESLNGPLPQSYQQKKEELWKTLVQKIGISVTDRLS